jgi:hypothetical protein
MYELPRNDSRREDASSAGESGVNDPLPLEEVDFKKLQC